MKSKKKVDKDLSKLLTVVYYTSNREDEAFEKKIRERLLETIGNLPLVSVSQKPIDFGKNICVGDVGVSNQNVFRQLQIGAMNATTPFIATAESDCLYPKEYFEYIPDDLNACVRYDNVWIMYKNSTAGFVQKAYSECAAIWGRENLIRHVEKRLKGRGMWNSVLEHGASVPKLFGKHVLMFHGDTPVINIKTTEGMHLYTGVIRSQDPKGVKKLPFWGTATKIRRQMFG